ncbi:MAG: ABC transporter ATP-binding protein [Pseudomonadota bacterium]
MIEFEAVTKSYRVGRDRKTVLNNCSFAIPRGRSLAVIGINGAGKSTLLRMIAGTSLPDRGYIRRRGVRVSFPLGFAGSFNAELSGLENIRFASRVYDCPIDQVTDYVKDFSELGNHLSMPVKTYSSGMRARLAFGLSMALDFDVYLVDEITAVGDANFRKKCEQVFDSKREHADVIMVSHGNQTLKRFCETSCVLDRGQLTFYGTVEEGLEVYADVLKRESRPPVKDTV